MLGVILTSDANSEQARTDISREFHSFKLSRLV